MRRPAWDGPHDPLVSDVYRTLPQREPGAALDTRVRALVAAELAGAAPVGPADEPGHEDAFDDNVIPLPSRPRWTVPLAAAASFVLALGLGLWFGGVIGRSGSSAQLTFEEAASEPALTAQADLRERVASPPTVLAQAETPSAPAPAAEPATPAGAVSETPAPPVARTLAVPPPTSPAVSDQAAPAAAGASAPAAAEEAPAVKPAAVPDELPPPAPPAAAPLAQPEAAPPADVAPASARAAKSPRPVPTLDDVRRLLRENKPAEARAALRRWRDSHPTEVLPEDLRSLQTESAGSAPAP